MKENKHNVLSFGSDYMEGCHPAILERLIATNMVQSSGYGTDEYSDAAKAKIRQACNCPDADIFFLVGGTQTNATVIGAMLKPYEGVIAAETGHISVHEAGAIEHGGHKVLTLPQEAGKIKATDIDALVGTFMADANRNHMVKPGLVYISQPTEYGTLYSLVELEAISTVCKKHNIGLFVDGARLAYALACPENDVTLEDLGRLTDAFYIGGTKCGAYFGEAVVSPKKDTVPHFFTIIKQNGALLAKGRLSGIQFDTLFTNNLYVKAGEQGIKTANRIRTALREKGYELAFPNPTNQIFLVLTKEKAEELNKKVILGFWETVDENRIIMRIATSWATLDENVDALIELL